MLDNYIKWVFLFLALVGPHFGSGYPVGPTPQTYPQDGGQLAGFEEKLWERNWLYGVLSTLLVVVVFASLLFGCMWCLANKHTKTDEGTGSQQLFTSSSAASQDVRGTHPPDSGFSELSNNNIAEANNNGPISLREMQNIANNNAAAYIVSENEERNRESVVEFEPLPASIRLADPLERCADWFSDDDLPRNRLQYLREIGRGWFGRVVEGEIEEEGAGSNSTVAVKILNQNASLEDKARFLDEAKMYRDVRHENILAFLAKCLQEDPWLLVFELCSMDLQQYLVTNRPKMAILNESGVPLRLLSDVASALAHLHQRGYLYGALWSGSVLVREAGGAGEAGEEPRARAVLGRYAAAPAAGAQPPERTASPAGEVWSLGALVWAVCAWGAAPPAPPPLPPPDLPCPYRTHLYQLMQLCWHPSPAARPSAVQVHALLEHLRTARPREPGRSDADSADFEERWQTLKPNTIPKTDEHVAIVHAPSTSTASHFTGSDRELETLHTVQDNLSVDMVVSRSSSIMSDRDPLSARFKSESLTNLHGSLDDVRNIYLTHNENPVLECTQANIGLDDGRDADQDRSDSSVDPWLKDIMAGSQDDVSYYKDVSDVIKNLDNILNSEKTSSSESSHQASPSRDNLSLDCKKEHPMQSSMVKSPGITNFQSVLDMGFDDKSQKEPCEDDEADRDTIGTLSHSFERYSDTTSQHTLENLTPDTPVKNEDISSMIESHVDSTELKEEKILVGDDVKESSINKNSELPKVNVETSDNKLLMLKELCLASISVSVTNVFKDNVQLNVSKDCQTSCDNILKETVRTDNQENNTKSSEESKNLVIELQSNHSLPPSQVEELISKSDSIQKIEQIEGKDDILEEDILPKLENNTTEQKIKVDDIPVVKSESVSCESKDQETGTAQDWSSQNAIPKLEEIIDNSKNTLMTSSVPINADHALNSTASILESDFQAISDHDLRNKSATLESSSVESEELICPISEDSIPEELKTNIDLIKPVTQEPILEVEEEKLQETNEENDTTLVDIQPLTILPLMPELVQNFIDREKQNEATNTIENYEFKTATNLENRNVQTPVLPSEVVQNAIDDQEDVTQELKNVIKEDSEEETLVEIKNETTTFKPADSDILELLKQHTVDSTVYMTLDNDTQVEPLINNTSLERDLNEATNTHLERSEVENANEILNNESTVYLDLPNTIKSTDDFLHTERIISCQTINFEGISASTPLASDGSAETIAAEKSNKENECQFLSETKLPDSPGILITKFEERFPHETASPSESPTKSHHTDTYDENSSVVLGPLENCTELFKGAKANVEEILAFSANFSEIDLETPSPLRDGNFLNEVPDIAHDDLHSDSVEATGEVKREQADQQTDDTDETDNDCGTERRVSPSTPPNSPGNFLVASTSQQKYLVDIDLYPPIEAAVVEPPRDALPDVDLNQIELQMTTKLAMAENENNMNIEYAGPVTVEGVAGDMMAARADDALPELLLAGNGGSMADMRQNFSLDEASVQALRNELELKLPLAQVASIEPPCEGEAEGEAWPSELPPPPDELVVSYPGALSPIAEETGLQLTAYENDAHWYPPTRTDSSESYLEPCDNSTDEVTDLPTGAAPGPPGLSATFTVHSDQNSIDNATYTIQKEVGSSRDMTMSADSLNASPYKIQEQPKTPSHGHTPCHTRNDEEKECSCERLSQESPFMLSPTADTSAPETLEHDNATGVSTLSRTTLATDAKLSKPSETQCVSKATSIDSWCSNDTLYNVEENFDDLASDPEGPPDYHPKDADHSESQTLTHNDDEKEHSHCSTYIVHDSKSEPCETFTPDSVTADDHYTYTKIKTDPTGASPATKSEVNDSTKTKDLAYGTLNSGLPSYSNCSTEVVSGFEEVWKVQQPELVRRSPMGNDVDLTPPKRVDHSNCSEGSPQLSSEHRVKKMDSVELSCLRDASVEEQSKEISENHCSPAGANENPNSHYGSMAPSVTSTPFREHGADEENIEHIPLELPRVKLASPDSVPNFQTFVHSAELRPQDLTLSPINGAPGAVRQEGTAASRESEAGTLSRNSNPPDAHSTNYSDFESSGRTRPSNLVATDNSSQSEFRRFENSARSRPQNFSSAIDATAMLLRSERAGSERAPAAAARRASQPATPALDISSLMNKSYSESHHSVGNVAEPTNYLMAGYIHNEEETEQPHSIIITERPAEMLNRTYNSHTSSQYVDFGFNSQTGSGHVDGNHDNTVENSVMNPNVNGVVGIVEPNIALETAEQIKEIVKSPSKDSIIVLTENNDALNLTNSTTEKIAEDVKCNGESQNYATVNFINENFEELPESNVDEGDNKDVASNEADEQLTEEISEKDTEPLPPSSTDLNSEDLSPTATEVKDSVNSNGVREEETLTSVTESFLLNEKKFCQFDAYLPLLNDIRFTGPASEVMSTSFAHEAPPEPRAAADALKDWDSDTDSRSSNSSSGEFIWKQRSSDGGGAQRDAGGGGAGGSVSGDSGSGSGSEGDEVEFVPSSWDCRAAPAKSSLRSLEATPESKKRVVFKRQKYHCVYEYPREAADAGADSPAAYLPDFSTYSEWDPASVEDAELGYGHLFGAPGPLDHYPLRTDFAFTTDYDEDFFISSSSRPFESLGLMTASQFFPGKHLKPALPEPDLAAELPPPPPPPPAHPPAPAPAPALAAPAVPALQTRAPSLDFTTPDSGVEDITPGSTSTDEEFRAKKLSEQECWRPMDSGSSSESVSPSSPGGEALGGLRHTRDKLKLDLPPSPHIPSPRHNRVFNFVLDKPKRRLSQDERPPLVMTDETPVAGAPLPLDGCEGPAPHAPAPAPAPEPTFSTFGKGVAKHEPEQKMILTDDTAESGALKEETDAADHAKVEAVKGEGTVLDSGDEDSGIESSSKATLERNKPAPNVS